MAAQGSGFANNDGTGVVPRASYGIVDYTVRSVKPQRDVAYWLHTDTITSQSLQASPAPTLPGGIGRYIEGQGSLEQSCLAPA